MGCVPLVVPPCKVERPPLVVEPVFLATGSVAFNSTNTEFTSCVEPVLALVVFVEVFDA